MKKKQDYIDNRRVYWNKNHKHRQSTFSDYYHMRLAEIFSLRISPHARVLEVGCGNGILLSSLNPARGVGVDFSEAAIAQAQEQHGSNTNLQFLCSEASRFSLSSPEFFDFIILSDLLNDLWDVQEVLQHVMKFAHPQTRLIVNMYSHAWELPLKAAQKLKLAHPFLEQNWLTPQDIANLLYLSNWETLEICPEIVFPIEVPVISNGLNKFLGKVRPFSFFAFSNFLIARPFTCSHQSNTVEKRSVSVVVPARNEAGNIKAILERVPLMGSFTELIFVEGNSTDDTREVIEGEIRKHSGIPASLYIQSGKGKGDAVRLGFSKAKGDILMILDADLTVAPEDLPRFYEALATGKGDFINGVRLVYPMEKEAMRFFNLIGNKFFSLAFSWVMGQSIKDTLCGTKVLWRKDYERLVTNRAYFGDFDPFGDFDLLFGAAKLNLKIIDMPIRYGERTYGETNIERWKHGWMLLQMLIFAARRLKFV